MSTHPPCAKCAAAARAISLLLGVPVLPGSCNECQPPPAFCNPQYRHHEHLPEFEMRGAVVEPIARAITTGGTVITPPSGALTTGTYAPTTVSNS